MFIATKEVGDMMLTKDRLNAVKARLGSIAPGKMNEFPKSVQKLLEVELPMLIEIAEAVFDQHPENLPYEARGYPSGIAHGLIERYCKREEQRA